MKGNDKENRTEAVNYKGEKVALKVQVMPIGKGRTREFASVENAAKYFKSNEISKAKNISTIVSNLESAIRGYEIREVRPCNRQTAYGCIITRQYNI